MIDNNMRNNFCELFKTNFHKKKVFYSFMNFSNK